MMRQETIERLVSYANGLYGNALMNSNFDIWQRGTSKASEGYLADRWRQFSANCTLTVTRQTFSDGQTDIPNNPKYYVRTVTSGNTTAGAESNYGQRIEDVRAFSGQTISISAWVRADVACNIAIEIWQFFDGSASVYGIGAKKFAVTTGWTKIVHTVDIPSVAGKTIGTNSFLGLQFFLGAGSNYNSRTDSLGNQNRQIDIAQVQVNLGNKVLPYCPKSYRQELQDCLRYYWRFGNVPYEKAGVGFCEATNKAFIHIRMPVPMRIPPTLSVSGNGDFYVQRAGNTNTVSSGFSIDKASNYTTFLGVSVASGLTAGTPCDLMNNNSVDKWIALEAEL